MWQPFPGLQPGTVSVRTLIGTEKWNTLFSSFNRHFLILLSLCGRRDDISLSQEGDIATEISAWAVDTIVVWVHTWLWMYLVCSPCSSLPSPSTSSLYLGLMTTMMMTDFCKIPSCCQLLQKTTLNIGVTLLSSWLTSFKYLSIHLVMPIPRIAFWNMSICQETGRMWVFVLNHWEVKKMEEWQDLQLVWIPDHSEIWWKE